MGNGRVLVLLLLVVSMMLVVVGVAPTAQAAGCSGYACDGRSSYLCDSDKRIPAPFANYAKYSLRTSGTDRYEAWLRLWYSPSCRAVWASLTVHPRPPAGSNCYVKVQRNSDGKALRAPVIYIGVYPEDDYAPDYQYGLTDMLNDANVTSYAWGYCKWATPRGATITLGTSSY